MKYFFYLISIICFFLIESNNVWFCIELLNNLSPSSLAEKARNRFTCLFLVSWIQIIANFHFGGIMVFTLCHREQFLDNLSL